MPSRDHVLIRCTEEIYGHPGAYQHYKIADPQLRHLHSVVRAYISSRDSAHDHDEALLPVDRPRYDERDHRNSIDHKPHHALQRIHGMDVSHAQRSQHGEHHDSHAATEISSVDSNGQLE